VDVRLKQDSSGKPRLAPRVRATTTTAALAARAGGQKRRHVDGFAVAVLFVVSQQQPPPLGGGGGRRTAGHLVSNFGASERWHAGLGRLRLRH